MSPSPLFDLVESENEMGNFGSSLQNDLETDFEEPVIDDCELEIDFEGVDFDEQFEEQNPAAPESVKTERKRFLAMTTTEKRNLFYADTDYVQLDEIARWTDFCTTNARQLKELCPLAAAAAEDGGGLAMYDRFRFEVDETLNAKVSPFVGDITTLEVDGIVNAASNSLLGGKGIDGAIHKAAGKQLVNECRALEGCKTGDAKTTAGYQLPAKYVVHTVGPRTRDAATLRSCYVSCMREMVRHGMRSIAFCCISTGVYGYPHERAVHVALRTVRRCLERMKRSKKIDQVDRVLFCLFRSVDVTLYQRWMQVYFPTQVAEDEAMEAIEDDDDQGEHRD